jgi:hypothetical protein
MDSCNLGFGVRIKGASDYFAAAIGNETVLRASSSNKNSPEVVSGFYAADYDTVIPYRGFVLPAKRSAEPGSIGRWCRPKADKL